MTNEEFIKSICIDGEEWRDISWLRGLYAISSEGRIVSLSREKRATKSGSVYKTKPFLMKQSIRLSNGIPYYNVGLTDQNGRQYRKTIHRLVCSAFHENPNGYTDVDHINRNSLDNRAVNLRWASRKMNMANENTRKIILKCHKGADKSYRWRPVIRMKDGVALQYYKSITEATKEGYNGHNITQVCRKEKHTHRGYQWVYADEYAGNPISSSNSQE